MQRTITLLRIFLVVAVFSLATLALPLSAQAGVRVSIGIGVPVYSAPVVVAPPPVVVYPAPVMSRPAAGGVWVCASLGAGPLWAPASPLATPSPPQAPLVTSRV